MPSPLDARAHARGPRTSAASPRTRWSWPWSCSCRVMRLWVKALVATFMLGPLVVLTGGPAAAAPIRSFTPVFSANTNGDVLIAANTLMTCSTAAGARNAGLCTSAAAGTGAYSNNDFWARYVDVDSDAATFNSSSATLTVPAGGSVLYALLVWGGRTTATKVTNADPAQRGTAVLTAPDGLGARAVTASRVDVSADYAYQATLDVTDVVAAAGSGTYTLANVQSSVGAENQYAGWSLVVAVADPSAPARNLTVFTGFASVGNNDALPAFTVSGFVTPPSGAVRTTMGAITYEGDKGYGGDTFLLNGRHIGDVLNPPNASDPTDNPFNSTISDRGVATTGRTPSLGNQLGYDADLFTTDGYLSNGSTSATIQLTSTLEQYFPGVVTFATDLYDPKLVGTKTVTDRNGGDVERGDVLDYEVTVENTGLDTASQSLFVDAVPFGTAYLPGTLEVDGVALTDRAGDDEGELVGGETGQLVARLGTGASASDGGEIPPSAGTPQHTVRFQVAVLDWVANAQSLINAASLTYQGRTTGAAAAAVSNVATSTVAGEPGTGHPPVARGDVVSFTPTSAQPSVSIAVLDNDTDADNDALTVIGTTSPAGGRVTVESDGTLTYTPAADFAGRDSFTYAIRDEGANVASATVQVDVLNIAPTAVDDAASTAAGHPVAVQVLANDTDPNGDALSVRSADALSAHGGSVTVTDGVLTYTPPNGYRGTDTVGYVAADPRGGSDDATVTLTVTNNAPVATADHYATTTGTGVAVSVLANDSDADGDALTATLLTGPAHGTLTLAANGTGTYTPTAGYAGGDQLTYRVSDGHAGTATATVTISVNGAPVAVDDLAATAGDTPLVGVDVLANDSDPNGDALTFTAVSGPAHGSAVVEAAGTVGYTPDLGWAGTDSVRYTISDGALTASGTLWVTVANQAPVARPDTASTDTSTTLVGVDVLANDSDVNVTAGVPGQALAVTAASADHGASVTVAADGTLTVVPAAGYAGTVTVAYTLGDGVGGTDTGTLTVTVRNGVPSAAADTAATATDTAVTVDVLGNDSDPNEDALSVLGGSLTVPVDCDGVPQGTVAGAAGGVRYTPAAGFAGVVTFGYEVTDGHGGTAAAEVTVTVANAAPTATADHVATPSGTPVTVDVLANDTDPNIPGTDQVLTVTGASVNHGASVVREADGRLTVTPATGWAGALTVHYTLGDGAGGTDTGTLTVTVANAAPVARDDTASTAYLTPVAVDLLANDTDANGDALTLVPDSVTDPVDARGEVQGLVTVVDGVATYVPPTHFSGVVTFRYAVQDADGDSSHATVTVTVANAPPVAARDVAKVKAGVRTLIPVASNDGDDDGGTVTVVAVTQPATGGTVSVIDGDVVFEPEQGYVGTVTFDYTVADGQGGTSTAEVEIEVLAAEVVADGGSGPELASTGLDLRDPLTAALLLVLIGAGLSTVHQVAPVLAAPGRRGNGRHVAGRHHA